MRTAEGSWKLPKLDSYNAVLRHALGGWETNGIITLESGSWMTFYSGKDNSATGLNRDRADLVGDPHLDTGRERNALINQYFNTAAFAVNGPNTFGTSGRNILQGPGSANVDFGVVKNFSVAERHRVQFRAEFFNLFNRVNLGNPNTTVVNKNFGKITSAGSPRVVQLALKYMF